MPSLQDFLLCAPLIFLTEALSFGPYSVLPGVRWFENSRTLIHSRFYSKSYFIFYWLSKQQQQKHKKKIGRSGRSGQSEYGHWCLPLYAGGQQRADHAGIPGADDRLSVAALERLLESHARAPVFTTGGGGPLFAPRPRRRHALTNGPRLDRQRTGSFPQFQTQTVFQSGLFLFFFFFLFISSSVKKIFLHF